MVLIKPEGIDGVAGSVLLVAEEHFTRTIKALDALSRRLQDSDEPPSAELEKSARLVSGATQAILNERQKIESSIRKHDGVVHDFALDFAAAREEIRGRMARLRAACDAGEVSE
jgi:hypothetical protein